MMIKNMKPVKKADHFVEVIGKTDEHLAKLLEYEHQNFID
jgi:cob(I)alamin adenosyltransferase